MLIFIGVFFIASGIALLLFGMILILSERRQTRRNSATPFECGFDPQRSARVPFSLRFFLLAVIFLIFDVEVVVLFPVLYVVGGRRSVRGVSAVLFFLVILLVGLFHEWREGSLDWV